MCRAYILHLKSAEYDLKWLNLHSRHVIGCPSFTADQMWLTCGKAPYDQSFDVHLYKLYVLNDEYYMKWLLSLLVCVQLSVFTYRTLVLDVCKVRVIPSGNWIFPIFELKIRQVIKIECNKSWAPKAYCYF